jgi:4-amino-4-deoxy-L-arabinose transferase-like glycosyltransferase
VKQTGVKLPKPQPSNTKRSDTGRPGWPAFLVFFTLLIPILACNHYISANRSDERDHFLFAVFGRELARGAELYGDVWDNKPPVIYWWNAASHTLFGGRMESTAATMTAAVVGACFLVWGSLRRFFSSSAAVVGALLFSFLVTHHYYHVGSNRPETLMILFDALGYSAFVHVITGGAWATVWMFLVGSACGLSLATKQVGLGLATAVMMQQTLAMLFGSLEVRAWLWRSIGWILGFATTIGLVWLAVNRWGNPNWGCDAIFGYNLELMQQRSEGPWWPQWVGMRDNWDAQFLPILLAASWVVYVIWNGMTRQASRHSHVIPSGHTLFLLIWLGASLLLSQAGPDGRMHYYSVALSPLLLLGAIGIGAALDSVESRNPAIPSIGSIVLVALVGGLIVSPVRAQLRKLGQVVNQVEDVNEANRRDRMVASIVGNSSTGDRMFAWGYDPELYWDTGLSPASRYIGTDKCGSGEIGRARQAELMNGLREVQPRVMLINAAVLDRLEEGDWGEISGADWVDWFRSNYSQPVEEFQGIWVLISP